MSQVDEKETQVIDKAAAKSDDSCSIDATTGKQVTSDGEEQGEQTTHVRSPVSSERVTRRDDDDEDDEADDDMDDDEDESSFKQQVTRGTKRTRDDADDEDTHEGVIDDEDASSELGDLTSKSKEVGSHFICLFSLFLSLIVPNKVHHTTTTTGLITHTLYLSLLYFCMSPLLHSCWVDTKNKPLSPGQLSD